jgi:hypothetical protein
MAELRIVTRTGADGTLGETVVARFTLGSDPLEVKRAAKEDLEERD